MKITLSMGFTRDKAGDIITSLSHPVLKHFIKIFKYLDEQNYAKHVDDIDSWLSKIAVITLKNGKPAFKRDLMNWLWYENVGTFQKFQRYISLQLKEYRSLPVQRTDEQIFELLEEMYKRICIDIEKSKFLDVRDYLP